MVILYYKLTKVFMNNLKNIIILPILFSATLALADNENYDGQDLSGGIFYGLSLKNSSWVGTNLTNAGFNHAILTNANFTNAIIYNVDFIGVIDFTKEQFYSTKNYKDKDLTGIYLDEIDLSDWDFTDTIIKDVSFMNTTSKGFSKEQLYSTKSYKDKDLTKVYLDENDLSGWNFSGQNLTEASFYYATLTDANFTNAIINNAYFNKSTLTKEQLYSTKSYQNKNLQGVSFSHINIENWDFTGVDLREANMDATTGMPIYHNTIMTDGVIKNFTMTSSEDTLVIRQFIPKSGNPMISAKISEANAAVSGGATLTLKTGAELEVVNNKTLTIASDGNLVINTDAAGSTSFYVESGAGLAFEDGAVLRVNIEGVFSPSDISVLTIMGWEDDSHVTGVNVFAVDETLFLTVNGEAYAGGWNYRIFNKQFQIVFEQIPEPAFLAAVLGAAALAFVARRRRVK